MLYKIISLQMARLAALVALAEKWSTIYIICIAWNKDTIENL